MDVDEKTMQEMLHRIELLESANLPGALRTCLPGVWYFKREGACPVDGDALVDIALSNGKIEYAQVASKCVWMQKIYESYVVRFRLSSTTEPADRFQCMDKKDLETELEKAERQVTHLRDLHRKTGW